MDQMNVGESSPEEPALTPGCLLQPFGWAAQPVAALLGSQPSLLAPALAMDTPRLHLIAFALAHLGQARAMRLGAVLFLARSSPRSMPCSVDVRTACGVSWRDWSSRCFNRRTIAGS